MFSEIETRGNYREANARGFVYEQRRSKQTRDKEVSAWDRGRGRRGYKEVSALNMELEGKGMGDL